MHAQLARDGYLTGPDFVTPELSWLHGSWALPFVRQNWDPDPTRRAPFSELAPALGELAMLPPPPPTRDLCETRRRVATLTRRRVRFGSGNLDSSFDQSTNQ